MKRTAKLNINLLPMPTRVRVPKILSLGVVFMALAAAFSTGLFMVQIKQINRLQAENSRLSEAVKNYQQEMSLYKPLQAIQREMTSTSRKIEAIEKTRLSHITVLNELDKVKPADITIVEMKINGSRVTVDGYSPDHSNISRLLKNVKDSHILTDVLLFSSERNENTDEVLFTLELEWGTVPK